MSRGEQPTTRVNTAGRPLPPAVVRVIGDLRFRLDGELLALCYAPDGTVWTVEDPGVLRQWQAQSGQQLAEHSLAELEVVWAFSPDARLVASASDDISIWEVATGRPITTLNQPSWVTVHAFRADGRVLVTGHDDGTLRLWDLNTGQLQRELSGHDEPISAVAFSPDGHWLVSAAEDRIINLWDADGVQPKSRLIGHSDRIQALAWHPQGRHLVSAGWDTTVRVWDATTAEPVFLLNGHAEVVSAVVYSPDGKLLASADSDRVVWIWDPVAGKVIHLLRGHGGAINRLAFSPDGRHLLSGGEDRQLFCWDVVTGGNLAGIAEQQGGARRIRLSPDGTHLACAPGTSLVKIVETASGETVRELEHPYPVDAICYSPDGTCLATGDALGVIRLWETAGGVLARSLELHHTGICALAFSPDNQTLASAGGTDGYVYLTSMLDFEPSLLIPEATGKYSTIETIAYVPGSNLLAVGGMDLSLREEIDGVVALWDTAKASAVTLPGGTRQVDVRPDGLQLAATTQDDSVELWDLATQSSTHELLGHRGSVTCVRYGRDGRFLVTASEDGTLRFWRSDTGEPVTTLDLDTPVTDLAVSPDNRWLYTANANMTCYVIDLGLLTR